MNRFTVGTRPARIQDTPGVQVLRWRTIAPDGTVLPVEHADERAARLDAWERNEAAGFDPGPRYVTGPWDDTEQAQYDLKTGAIAVL